MFYSKRLLVFLTSILVCSTFYAQIMLTSLPSGGNKRASVSEQIGLVDVQIHYSRPGVKGREGKIWGSLIHKGLEDPGFGNSKAAPWRAGANENTTISFSRDVTINNKPLAAGKYGLFIMYDSLKSTVIFSKNANSWGHYFYNPAEDALRIEVEPKILNSSVEWLTYEFTNQMESSASVELKWEKLSIPFTITTDYINDQLAIFRSQLRTSAGFIWQPWNQAAQWCVDKNVNLQEALLWADTAIGPSFGGDRSFPAYATKAQILSKLGRNSEADVLMQKSLAFANMTEIHQYARQLLTGKRTKEAFEIFKMNHDKNPNQYTTVMGLMRGYSALGDYKNAIKYGNQALLLSPNPANRTYVENLITKLKENKDIN